MGLSRMDSHARALQHDLIDYLEWALSLPGDFPLSTADVENLLATARLVADLMVETDRLAAAGTKTAAPPTIAIPKE